MTVVVKVFFWCEGTSKVRVLLTDLSAIETIAFRSWYKVLSAYSDGFAELTPRIWFGECPRKMTGAERLTWVWRKSRTCWECGMAANDLDKAEKSKSMSDKALEVSSRLGKRPWSAAKIFGPKIGWESERRPRKRSTRVSRRLIDRWESI